MHIPQRIDVDRKGAPIVKNMLSIGQLSELAGLAPSAIRFYEKKGLLSPAGRTDSNYRFYASEALERLHFIRSARHAGFTLDDIASILAYRQDSASECVKVRSLVEQRLDETRTRLCALREVESQLTVYLKLCLSAESRGCPSLDRICEEVA